MEPPPSIAEQRATAVAKLKRAASLPRMKDGRRPPMHVEAVSEGERGDKPDEESALESDSGKAGESADVDVYNHDGNEEAGEERSEDKGEQEQDPERLDAKADEARLEVSSPERPTTPAARRRRSRSRARSRNSKDLRNKIKTPPPATTNATAESSADEYAADDRDIPPSPPVISPIPHWAQTQASHLLRSPISPRSPLPMLYPGTTPPTPILPSLDDIQKYGLFRSNSVGAARMMTMQKLTGGTEPVDGFAVSPSHTPLARNNTVAGGERMEARRNLLRRLNERVERADTDATSGEELNRPATQGTSKRKKRRSKHNSSRISSPVDDTEDQLQSFTSTNTPLVPPSPLPPSTRLTESPFLFPPERRRTPAPQPATDAISSPLGGRGPLVEDEDDDTDRLPLSQHPVNGFRTPARRTGQQLPHSSDAPSILSTDSSSIGIAVPLFMSRSESRGYRQDMFPASPFATPLREKPYGDEDEDSDRETHLRAPSRANNDDRAKELSWIDDPAPLRMPINDDEDDEDDEDQDDEEQDEDEPKADEPHIESETAEEDGHNITLTIRTEDLGDPDNRSSRSSYSVSKSLVIETETSPGMAPSQVPPSPLSPVALSSSEAPESLPEPRSPSPVYPMRLSVATPVKRLDHSPSVPEFTDAEDNRPDATPKRGGDGPSPWERLKNTLTRSNSSNGRRSRTNSFSGRERRYNTDSSVSRESGMSQSSVKEKGDRSSIGPPQQSPSLVQSPSASGSILSLAPHSAPPGGSSPVPPASAGDSKYTDPKLFPFPGMKQLEEQLNRSKGLLGSSSSPDVLSPGVIEAVPSSSSSSSATTKSPQMMRERKLSHQASDSRLLPRFSGPSTTPAIAPSSPLADYFSSPSLTTQTTTGGGSLKLPMNREGVKKWLTAKKLFSSQSSAPATPVTPSADGKTRTTPKKPSLSDLRLLVNGRKDNDLPSDWEDSTYDKAKTPTGTPGQTLGKPNTEEQKPFDTRVNVPELSSQIRHAPTLVQSPPVVQGFDRPHNGVLDFPAFPSPPEPALSTTPDPQSSLDDYTVGSTSESLSSGVSSSTDSPEIGTSESSKAAIMLERLDEVLGRGSKSSVLPVPLDDPPRKLVLSSPVLQVANANTVKDRFLFLFNDTLVIAKPIVQDQDVLLDPLRPTPMDRKFIVKTVALLRDVKFNADRDESRTKMSACISPTRHPIIRNFVHQFTKDPDQAIVNLFSKSNCRDDPVALGQLIFRTTDLDRVRLGEYLSQRTSKVVLKAYLDSFGFTGLRIDKALRVFLLSVWIPKGSLEYLLDSFASRWYEANVGVVAYGRDLAAKLTRSIVQLNEVLHGGITQIPGMTGYPKRNVIGRDFIEAFRRLDPRYLVSDELLEKIYAAIRRERLSQARNPSTEPPTGSVLSTTFPISIKRPLPPRLTYRIQSEPVILRIPAPDPHISIQLFGQDVVFDPPVLSFAKSAEASFRITGTSLGPKTIVMWPTGPNALSYTGLPLSSPLMVERAFMRNTFQLAFMDHTGAKRKYMFSVDDPMIRHQWTVYLKRQIELASASPTPSIMQPSGSSTKLQRAIEDLTLKVLQDTLIGAEDASYPSAVDNALARLNGVTTNGRGDSRRSRFEGNIHTRSKSRSKMYHKHGAGRLEPENDDDRDVSGDEFLRLDVSSSQRPEDRLWSGRDLEIVCRQNSTLPAVLTYLRVNEGHTDAKIAI